MRDWIHFYCEPKGSNVFCFNAIMEAITRDQGALKENVNLIFFFNYFGRTSGEFEQLNDIFPRFPFCLKTHNKTVLHKDFLSHKTAVKDKIRMKK